MPVALPDSSASARAADPWHARVMRVLMVVWVFVLVLGFLPLLQNPFDPLKYALCSAITVAMGLVWFVGSFRGEGESLADGWIGWALSLFLLVHGLTPAFCSEPWLSLYSVAPWFSFGLVAFMVPVACRRVSHVVQLLGAVVIAVGCSSVYGLMQRWGFDPVPWMFTDRYEYLGLPSTYGHPNFAGHAIVIALCASIVLFRRGRRLLWLMPVVALIAWHLWETGMRAGWLALGAAGVALFIVSLTRNLSRDSAQGPVAVIGIFLALLGTGVLVFAGVMENLAPRALPIDSAWILRLNSFHGATAMFFERPLFGWGTGRYEAMSPAFWSGFEERWYALYEKSSAHVHNETLEVAVESGVAGVASLLALWLVAVFRSVQLAFAEDPRVRRLGTTCTAAFIALTVDAQFGFNLHLPVSGGLFFLLLGTVYALYARREPAGRAARLGSSLMHTALAGAVCAALGLGLYMDFVHQRARGAIAWALEQRDPRLAQAANLQAHGDLLEASGFPIADADLWRDRAKSHERLQELDAADAAYRRALQIAPHDPALLSSRARLLARDPESGAEQLDEASEMIAHALKITPDNPEAYGALYAVEQARERLAEERGEEAPEAVAAAREALEKQVAYARETFPAAWALLAHDAVDTGDYVYAETLAAAAVADTPGHGPSWRVFERVYEEAGRYEAWRAAASAALGDALQQSPPPPYGADRFIDLIEIARGEQSGLDAHYVDLALAAYPNRMAFWGYLARSVSPEEAGAALAAKRAELGDVSEQVAQAIEPITNFIAAAEARDWEALREALNQVAYFANAMEASGGGKLEREWKWLGALAESAVESEMISLEETAEVLLPVVDLYSAVGAHEDVLRVTPIIGPFLEGEELARLLHARSLAYVAEENEPEALRAARQAGALAPFALSIRWNLAVRLWRAGRLAEAEFEFSTQAPKLRASDPGYREMVEQYEAFRAEREAGG